MLYREIYDFYANFCPIPKEDWMNFEKEFRPQKYKQGENIFISGVPTQQVFVILKGVVKTFYIQPNGKEYIKIFLTPGHIVSPYIELLAGIPPRATAQTLTDVEGVALNFQKLMEILKTTDALKTLHMKLLHHFYAVKEKREFEFLTMDATQRYINFCKDYERFLELIPKAQIAYYLGITPVSLSRILKEMKS